jgi:hypothetical protein
VATAAETQYRSLSVLEHASMLLLRNGNTSQPLPFDERSQTGQAHLHRQIGGPSRRSLRTSGEKQVVHYSRAITIPARKIPAMGGHASHTTKWSAEMPSAPDPSNMPLNASPSADQGFCDLGGALEMTVAAAEKVSPPPAVISEQVVILGTAAATAVTPSFEGELEDEDPAIEQQDAAAEGLWLPTRSGWISRLARRVRTSRDGRPPKRHYPSRLDSDFIADARMDRETYRL